MKFLKSLLIVFALSMFISCTTQEGEIVTNEKTEFNVDYLSKSKEFAIITDNLNSISEKIIENPENSYEEFEIIDNDILISFSEKVIAETNFLKLNENEGLIIFYNYYKKNQNKDSKISACERRANITYLFAVIRCHVNAYLVNCCMTEARVYWRNQVRRCVCPQCGSSGVPGCSGN